jgi:hypothetical protein
MWKGCGLGILNIKLLRNGGGWGERWREARSRWYTAHILLKVSDQGSPLFWGDSLTPAHCIHRRQSGPLSQLFQPHCSSCRVFFGSEKQRPLLSPGPPLPQSNWLPLPLTAPEQQPSPRPPSGSVPFPFMVKLREGKEWGEGSSWVELRGAAPLTRDPQTSTGRPAATSPLSPPRTHDPSSRLSQPFFAYSLPHIRGVISHLAEVPRLGFDSGRVRPISDAHLQEWGGGREPT